MTSFNVSFGKAKKLTGNIIINKFIGNMNGKKRKGPLSVEAKVVKLSGLVAYRRNQIII